MNQQRHQHGSKLKTGLALLTLLALAACGGGSSGDSGSSSSSGASSSGSGSSSGAGGSSSSSGASSGSSSSGASGSSGGNSSGVSSSGASSSGAASSSGGSGASGSSGVGSSGGSSSGGSSGSSSGAAVGSDPAGLYLGILENPASGASNAMWGLIDSKHQAVFIDQTAVAVYRYTSFTVSSGKVSGGYVSFTPSSSGGAAIGGGTAHSSFAAGDSLTGYLAFSDATLPAYSFSDSYQSALYDIPAAFATIAGTYTFGSNNGSSISVASDGSFTLAYTGCTAKGSFSIPDPAHNAYELSGTQTCSGAVLPVTGLASYTPPGAATSAQLTFEYDDGKTVAVQAAATR